MQNLTIDARIKAGQLWAEDALGHGRLELSGVSGDASFRRYFRLRQGQSRWILMDAPPEQEDTGPFIDIATRLRAAGICAPGIVAANRPAGFLLLEDFGDELIRDVLTKDNADRLFPAFFMLLADMSKTDLQGLPDYHRGKLLEELELFTIWYLQRHKGLQLSCGQWDHWEVLGTALLNSAAEQPQLFVHRDFHSCNLLRLPQGGIGVIDFQDAVRGPLTYDFVSLLWDRYIHWPRSLQLEWMEAFRLLVCPGCAPAVWRRWCDWMGLQRNLKIVGIFARLHYRDSKAGYLEMIPQFWTYVIETLERYEEFAEFRNLLEELQCAP
jgi:aminoglycoside/choline kinase family phosphotransferase